jgi:RND family efflux transporter MFP subunit
MKRDRLRMWIARGSVAGVAALMAVVAMVFGAAPAAGGQDRPGLNPEDAVSGSAAVTRVRVEPALAAPALESRRYVGTVRAADGGPAAFLEGGRVSSITVSVGETVEQGRVVATLDQRGPRLALQETRAALASVDEQLAQAERELARVARLGDAATEQELDQRRSAVLQLSAARDRAAAGYANAQRRLDETELVASYDAVVTAVMVEESTVVAAGQPVAVLSSLAPRREIEILVGASAAAVLERGAPVLIRPTLDDPAEHAGRIRFVSRNAASPSMLFPILIDVTDSASILAGTPAEVELTLPTTPGFLSVPASAVVGGPDGRPRLYAVQNGRVAAVALDRVLSRGDRSLIPPVLPEGTDVIVSGQVSLVDGLLVEAVR